MFSKKQTDNESSFWISYTDMVTGFMIVFIVISFILFTQKNEKHKLKGKYEALVKEFKEKFKDFQHIEVTDEGCVRFLAITENNNEIELFKDDVAVPTKHFQNELISFIPIYYNIVQDIYDKDTSFIIKELRIEGHASTEGSYAHNLDLSGRRALRVFTEIVKDEQYLQYPDQFRKFINKNTIACGYSFSRALNKSGGLKKEGEEEDLNKSKRVEFRLILEYLD